MELYKGLKFLLGHGKQTNVAPAGNKIGHAYIFVVENELSLSHFMSILNREKIITDRRSVILSNLLWLFSVKGRFSLILLKVKVWKRFDARYL